MVLRVSEIEAHLDRRDFAAVRAAIADRPPGDVAELIGELGEGNRAVLFRILPRAQAAETFEYLTAEIQEGLIRALAQEQVALILNDMSPDDRTALLEELPASVTRQLLALLAPEERAIARRLLGYPEDSVGRLMTPYALAIGPKWTVLQALEHIRRHGEDSETLNVVYVVSERGRLLDDLRIRQLLLAEPEARIEELMDGHFVALQATDDQESAVRVLAEYDRVAVAVTDTDGQLLGIVTVDDVLDVAEEEATEDIQKIGGMEALEAPYMQASFAQLLRKRAGWLVLLFLGQLITIHAILRFSHQLEAAAFLVAFVPLIISSGGNSGSQAATLVVRAMALEEVTARDWFRVLRREAGFGMSLGLLLATIGSLRIAVGSVLGESFDAIWTDVALVVGLSLVGVVLWGVLIGSMLPFVLSALGADPATSSTPFVATIVDVTGLLLYLIVASFVLF